MYARGLTTALVTANVFHNALSQWDPWWTHYYTEMLCRLSEIAVNWYISELDFDLAFTFWDVYQLGGNQACREAYLSMLEKLQRRTCKINQTILEEASNHQTANFFDAIRLACAVDRTVDVIVTWEPHQFAQTLEDHYRIHVDGYFYRAIPTEPGEPDHPETYTMGIFSVRAFLIHLDHLNQTNFSAQNHPPGFSLEDFQVHSSASQHSEATVILLDPAASQLQATAAGSTAFDAIQRAIDQAIDSYCTLPPRSLNRFFVPASSRLQGADSPVEVVLGVECDGFTFEASASHNSMLQAAAEAYIKAINSIYRRFLGV